MNIRNYSDSDHALVAKAQEGDLNAEEALMRKYKEAVKKKAKMYYMAGADEEDIVQEGMIGLLKAIRQYDAAKETSFGTFAGICITSQIISAIRTASREKHKALNTSVSLNNPMEHENEEITLESMLRTNTAENPETLLIMKDVSNYILNNGNSILSDFELQVLNEAIKERDYGRIARKLGKSAKSIDNAMQRIKKKIMKYLWH